MSISESKSVKHIQETPVATDLGKMQLIESHAFVLAYHRQTKGAKGRHSPIPS
jgi:hypothetical protein